MRPNPVRNGSLVRSAGGPSAQRLMTRATRNVWWTSDWVCWAGQFRTVRKLERVGWTHQGPRDRSRPPGYGRSTASAGAPRALVTGRGYPDTDAQLCRLELSGPRPPVAATRIIKPGGLVTKDHGPESSNPDGSLESRLGLRDQAKTHGGQEYQGPVDHGLNILGRSPLLTQVCTTGHYLAWSLT